MPVTAKLSRRFYETFGDELTNELVEWFNQVDATYRSELRELNDVNYARFESKLDQRLAEFRVEVAGFKGDLVRWMFVFWATSLGTLVALLKL